MSNLPWPHRPIALLALVLYLAGAADYLAVRLQFGPWMAWLSPDQIAFVTGLPVWLGAGWAIGTWAGLLGALLLWSGRHGAAALFALAFAGLAVTSVGVFWRATPGLAEIPGAAARWTLPGVLAMTLLFHLYARWLNRRYR